MGDSKDSHALKKEPMQPTDIVPRITQNRNYNAPQLALIFISKHTYMKRMPDRLQSPSMINPIKIVLTSLSEFL